MMFWWIPLDSALPVLQAYLDARGEGPLDEAEVQHVAELLERSVRTSEALTTFALQTGGCPCRQ